MSNMVKSIALFLSLGPLFSIPASLLADQEEVKGKISGSLVNGTTGERVPELGLILKTYEGDKELEGGKTVSDKEGKFYFTGLELGKKRTYFLYTLYKGVEYYSPPILFEDEKREMPLEITVYDPTDSDKKVSVVMHHVLLEPREGALWVRELMIVENTDNKVYVGAKEIAPDKKETIRISLPPQAQELQTLKGLMSCCIVQLQDGFADTMDIKPGRKEVQFSYKVEYGASSLALPKKINLTTNSLDFFIPKGTIRAEGENIQYAGLLGEPGKELLHFTGKKLTKGTQVALNLESLPRGRIGFKKAVPVLGVTFFMFALAYPFLRRVRRSHEAKVATDEVSRDEPTPQEQRQNLILAIAQLDDQLVTGQISPEEHERQRRVLKQEVIELTKALRDEGI